MKHRPTLRRVATPAFARSSRAALAVAISAGVVLHSSAHPAIAEGGGSIEDYLANLVGDVSDAEAAVAAAEGKLGAHREQANKARVDFDLAQQKAQAAQKEVLSARDRLTDSDKEVASAQKRLDEIARSAYSAGGSASSINLAAGKDSVRDTLDRASYLHLAAEKQRGEVNRLDLARTQNANQESSLRSSRSAADDALNYAKQLYSAAEQAVAGAQQTLASLTARYNELVELKEAAQARLRAAKSAIDKLLNQNPNANSYDKRRAAEAAADNVADPSDDASSPSEASTEPESPEESATPTTTSAAPTSTTGSTATSTYTETTSAETTSTTTSSSVAVTETPATTQLTETSETTAVTTTKSSAATSELSSDLQTFDESSAGDSQRQQAIDGLIEAGSEGFMTGFGSLQGGADVEQAVNNGASAVREHAANAYDHATGSSDLQNPATGATSDPTSTTSTANSTTSTTGTSASGSTETTATTATESASTTDTSSASGTTDTETDSDTATTTDDSATTSTTSTNGESSTTDNSAASGSASEQIEQVINRAMSQVGVSYAWGGGNWNGPTQGIRDGGVADSHGDYNKVGFDCSGLMMYAFYAVGIQLQHYSGYQYTAGRQVPVSEAKRGDMLFWGPGGSQHVALYLGNDQMVEAPNSGSVVRVSSVRWNNIQPYAVRMIE